MKQLYSIYDVKASSYAPPFVAANEADASRQIAMALMASPSIPPSMYPEDFYLVYLGSWDEVTGEIKSEIIRHCSCEWILLAYAKRPAAEKAEELKKEGVENA